MYSRILYIILAWFFIINSVAFSSIKRSDDPVMPISGRDSSYKKFSSNTIYDDHFKKYSDRYFGISGPNLGRNGWMLFKAQAIAESGLNPDARSQVGAQGLMQHMPTTWSEVKRKDPSIIGAVNNPQWAIAGGIFYDRTLWDSWSPKKTIMDKIKFVMASYNAGMGNIIKAQKLCAKSDSNLDPNEWSCVETNLPRVTGNHSKETIGYVDKIELIYNILNSDRGLK